MKHILIATDGSDHALKAAQFAGELAAGMNAELHVLAVIHHDRAGERALREFARIENLEGGVADIARNLAESHVGKRDDEPRLKAPKQSRLRWRREIRPRKSSPISRPKASTPSSWAGEGGAAWRDCFSAAHHRS